LDSHGGVRAKGEPRVGAGVRNLTRVSLWCGRPGCFFHEDGRRDARTTRKEHAGRVHYNSDRPVVIIARFGDEAPLI
jgi:hypothetical protein